MRFFSKVPGSVFVFSDGVRAVFAHGFLDVNEKNFPGVYAFGNAQLNPEAARQNGKACHEVYQDELLALVKAGNPLIFTQDTVKQLQETPSYATAAQKAAKSEAEIAQGDAALRGVDGRVSGDLNTGRVVVDGGDVNQSTVDPSIQAAMLKARETETAAVVARPMVGPGAGAAADAKARILANQQKST